MESKTKRTEQKKLTTTTKLKRRRKIKSTRVEMYREKKTQSRTVLWAIDKREGKKRRKGSVLWNVRFKDTEQLSRIIFTLYLCTNFEYVVRLYVPLLSSSDFDLTLSGGECCLLLLFLTICCTSLSLTRSFSFCFV